MHRARGLLASVLAGLLVVTGCSGCGDESTATTDPGQQIKPDGTDPETMPPGAPAKPEDKPDKKPPVKMPSKKPLKSDVDKAIEKLERLGVTLDRRQRDDGSYEPVRAVWISNNNRHAQEALKSVAKLTSIKFLHIKGGSVGDADLFYLLPLVNLESLKLRDTKVTSHGLAYLQNLGKLEYLNLINTKVDDTGMAYLVGLKNLRTLSLGGTRVSSKAAEELKKRLPKLTIK